MGMNNLWRPAAFSLMQFWPNPRHGHATTFRKCSTGLISNIFVSLGLTQEQDMQLCSIFITAILLQQPNFRNICMSWSHPRPGHTTKIAKFLVAKFQKFGLQTFFRISDMQILARPNICMS